MSNTKLNKQEVIEEVKKLADSCGSIIDALVEICSLHDIEIETIAQHIKYSKEIKERVRLEGIELNMLNE